MVKYTRKHSELPGNCSGTTPLTFIQSKIGSMGKNGQKWAKSKYLTSKSAQNQKVTDIFGKTKIDFGNLTRWRVMGHPKLQYIQV